MLLPLAYRLVGTVLHLEVLTFFCGMSRMGFSTCLFVFVLCVCGLSSVCDGMLREDSGFCLCLFFLLFVHVLFVYMCCLSSVCVVTSPILQRFSYQIITCRVNSLFFCFHLSLESNGLFYSTFFKIDFLYYHLKWL